MAKSHEETMKELGSNLQEEPRAKPIGMPETRRIILEESDDIPPTGLFIGHNGKSYLLRTGEPVDAPLFLIEILDHAVKMAPVVNPQTRQVVNWRKVHRFAYRYVNDEPPREPARAA